MNARRTFTTGAEALSRATSGTGARKLKVRVADRAGSDRFTATATNAATGATCRGALTFAG